MMFTSCLLAAVLTTGTANPVAQGVEAVSSQQKDRGVVLLTFDDRNFDNWLAAVPLFDKYGAHATFFVCGEIDDAALGTMKRLREHGHSVGLHGRHHADATNAVAKSGFQAYYASEIRPQLGVFESASVPITAFAYPNCRRNAETDRELCASGFRRVRGGVLGATPYDPTGVKQKNRKPLVTNAEVFSPVAGLPTQRLLNTILVGEVYHTDIAEIKTCLERVAKNREVITITSHGISPGAKGIDMKTEWLEEILKSAKALGLRIIGFDELPPPR